MAPRDDISQKMICEIEILGKYFSTDTFLHKSRYYRFLPLAPLAMVAFRGLASYLSASYPTDRGEVPLAV